MYIIKILKTVLIFAIFFCANVFSSPNYSIEGMPSGLNDKFQPDSDQNINEIANNLVYFLENEGYFLSTVQVKDSVIFIDLGEIKDFSILGINEKTKKIASSYLEKLKIQAPRIDELEHIIGLLNDIHGLSSTISFERINNTNDYHAIMSGIEKEHAGSISIMNIPTDDFSGGELMFHEEIYSVITGGDILRFEGVVGEQSDSESYFGEISYQFPINTIGSFSEFRISHINSAANYNFRNQNSYETKTNSVTAVLGHQFLRTITKSKTGYVQLDYRNDDDNFTSKDEHAAVRASWFSLEENEFGDTFSYGLTLSAGQKLSDSDQNYSSIRAGLGYISWIPLIHPTTEVLIEISAQIGSKDQPVFELFSFGGMDKQRGFSSFQYAGNNGISATVEVANTIYPNKLNFAGISPYLFVDGTYINNKKNEVSIGRPENNELVSIGMGSRFTFNNSFSLNAWIASPIHDGENSNLSKQPEFYLQGQYTW